ncbi:glycoside hydrolase family 5 protein [Phlegmacium glaucopus]|nr:glycoside hydrolase family 5 protein [Phlegmacium glaucopus]
MPSTFFFCLSFIVASVLVRGTLAGLPSKIYGVNLGSWLVLEPWILPDEWVQMGGQICDDCSTCITTEFAFAQAYPDTVDAKFKEHWETWFTQDDVDQLVGAGINTVRIPLGYWIVEPLVNRATEFYPRGGMSQLQRGLSQLKDAGIAVVLDHHALPGVATPNQMFAGRCTTDVQFYTPYNFHRALVWTAVMTALLHVDPNFSTVAALEAIQEPIMDATQTPGLGEFEKNFVQTIRAVEYSLSLNSASVHSGSSSNVTEAMATTAVATLYSSEIRQVLREAIPMIVQIASELNINLAFDQDGLRSSLSTKEPLVANFMDIHWQYNGPPNPADAVDGPQAYDGHLYYSFGGVADPNEEAYLTSVCNLKHIQDDAALRNSPLWFGEWSLSTQFSASDDFLKKWADAQKFSYGKGAGWIFWNFKIENSATAAEIARQWSYFEGLQLGYLTQDPSEFHNPHICDP